VRGPRSDDEFRDFVAAFADPLGRLTYLLTVGATGVTDGSTDLTTTDALARVRRRWREADVTGAPEALAVEALLSALPRRRLGPLFAAAAEGQVEVEAEVDGQATAEVDGQATAEVDAEVMREGAWKAWQSLRPRQRVPLVFADPSVASRRLAAIDVPESFGSPRRQDTILNSALTDIRARMRSDPSTRRGVLTMSDREIVDLVTETLREHSSTASPLLDPYPIVTDRLHRIRRRAGAAVVGVVVVLAAGALIAVQGSTSKQAAKRATAAALSSFHPAPPAAEAVAPDAPALVVDWPTRGNALDDVDMLASLRTDFVQLHPDAVGQVQVLLATDTSAFRLAYVTANSPSGVIQSWFFGPIGSARLVEGAWRYGGGLPPGSVVAAAVSDPAGDTEFVVIAPPTAADMQLFNYAASGPSFEPLADADGLAVKDLSGRDASRLVVSLDVDGHAIVRDHVDERHLLTRVTITLPSGAIDPVLLSRAPADGQTQTLSRRRLT
jgi:hypothetical protein